MLGGAFQIGRSALASYQAALAITGQNIANVANPNYARQSGRLIAEVGGPFGGIGPGGGVRLAQLVRHVDGALEHRLRLAIGARAGSETLLGALDQTEALYNELTEQDLSTQLSEFFAAFSTLQTDPQDIGARDLIVAAADSMIRTLDRQRDGLIQQVSDLNDQAEAAVREINAIAEEIAGLNARIVANESDGVSVASALRDRRDGLLRDLGELVDIQVREQESGELLVYVGSEPLVQFDLARSMTIERRLEDGLEIATVRFADTNSTVIVREGRLGGLLGARDAYVRDQLDRLDELARGLIFEVNRAHSTGVGLIAYESMQGNYAVLDPDAALNSDAAGLPFPVRNGTFLVHVRDKASGAVITRQIEVDLDGLNNDDTSLSDLAAALDGVPGLSATVTADRRLEVNAGTGSEFWFSDDRSDALAALGLGAFFVGQDAESIDVAQPIREDVRRIAASVSGALNDGDNAGRIARLASRTSVSDLLGGRSIPDFHQDIVTDLAVSAAAARTDFEAADAVHASLFAQREAVSGVSLDEEAINLSRFETAYQGAARYLNVVDELTTELMGLL
jgi:flagellar hook-associated protein 1 FlgK